MPIDGKGADDGATPRRGQVAGGGHIHPLAAAAMVGGAVAAGAGAYFGRRAMARRNARDGDGKVSPVMQAAITACDVNGTAPKRRNPAEPPVPREPAAAREPVVE